MHLKVRSTLRSLGLLAALNLAASHASVQRPNIVFIIADDQGYADAGCQGHPTLETPEIDRLAADGVRLTSFYAGASVCSPARVALLTGQYPVRHGITTALTHEELKGLAPGTPTLPRWLQAAGYETALIGKWHLGKGDDALPNRHGFDHFFGFLSTNNSYPTPEEIAPERLAPAITWNDGADLLAMQAASRDKTAVRVPYVRDGRVVEYPADNARHTERLTAEAIAFIRAKHDKPFFLLLAHAMPHYPLAEPYPKVIADLDRSLGEIRRALAEIGEDKNTIIVYTSDNGAAAGGRYFTGASNAPLSGGKGDAREGGHRVLCIVAAPGLIPAGRVSDQLVAMMDFYPTLLAAAGATLPRTVRFDGTDHWPFFRGAGEFSARESYAYFVGPRLAALRVGARKYERAGEGPARLFDVTADLAEKRDLAAEQPAALRELAARFEAAANEIPAP